MNLHLVGCKIHPTGCTVLRLSLPFSLTSFSFSPLQVSESVITPAESPHTHRHQWLLRKAPLTLRSGPVKLYYYGGRPAARAAAAAAASDFLQTAAVFLPASSSERKSVKPPCAAGVARTAAEAPPRPRPPRSSAFWVWWRWPPPCRTPTPQASPRIRTSQRRNFVKTVRLTSKF